MVPSYAKQGMSRDEGISSFKAGNEESANEQLERNTDRGSYQVRALKGGQGIGKWGSTP